MATFVPFPAHSKSFPDPKSSFRVELYDNRFGRQWSGTLVSSRGERWPSAESL